VPQVAAKLMVVFQDTETRNKNTPLCSDPFNNQLPLLYVDAISVHTCAWD